MNSKNILYIGAILVVVLIIKQTGFGGFFGGIVGIDCPEFKTNAQGTYHDSSVWIAVDCDNDGNYEGYGYSGGGCVSSMPVVTGTTPEGYDYECKSSTVNVRDTTNTACCSGEQICVAGFSKWAQAASSADTSCDPCPNLRASALSSITSWSNNPTSDNKNNALNNIVSWTNSC